MKDERRRADRRPLWVFARENCKIYFHNYKSTHPQSHTITCNLQLVLLLFIDTLLIAIGFTIIESGASSYIVPHTDPSFVFNQN